MADQLFIRFDADSIRTRQCAWIVLDGEGRSIAGPERGSIDDVGKQAEGRKVVLLIPGIDAITTQAELPSTSQSRMRQMIPFALEDALAEDVDRLVFGIGKRYPSGSIAVSVVSREKLDAWLGLALDAGISPSAVYVDSDGVDDTPSTLNIVVDGDVCYGRRPGEPAFALQGLGLLAAFNAAAHSHEDEAEIQHAQIFIDSVRHEGAKSEIEQVREELSSLSVRLMEDGALPGFAAKLVHEPGTNLLQGAYAPRSNWAALGRPWRVAALLLVGLLVVGLLGRAVEYFSLKHEDSTLTEVLTSRCANQIGTPRIAQCEADIRDLLRRTGQGNTAPAENFISMLAAVTSQMNANMRFRDVTYRDGTLNLRLLAADIPAIDSLRQNLVDTQRFDVNISSTTQEGERVEGRISIAEAAP